MSPPMRRRYGSIARAPQTRPDDPPPDLERVVDATPPPAADPEPPNADVPLPAAPDVDVPPLAAPDGAGTDGSPPQDWATFLAAGPTDLMPTRPAAGAAPISRARRRARRRRAWIAGIIGAGGVVAILAVVATAGGDDAAAPVARDHSTTSTSRIPSSTSTSASTSAPADGAAGASAPTLTPPDSSAGSSGKPQVVVASAPGSGRDDGTFGGVLTWNEDPGACRFDPATGQGEDGGTLQNAGTEQVMVDVNVTWMDGDTSVGNFATLVTVLPGDSQTWSLAQGLDPAPRSLRCVVTLS